MDNRAWASGASATPPAAPASPSMGYPTTGDPLTATPATKGGAFWFHQIGEEMRAVLVAAGITPSTANNAQLLEAIQRLIDAQSGNYALDTGAANAYVVALSPAITAYANGMTVRVKAVNKNTGASTLNAGAGAVALLNDVGSALVDGDVPAGGIFTATYIASANGFYITGLVPSQAMSVTAADARYAMLLPGQIIDFAGTAAPTGFLACPTSPTNVSRTTYAALFAAIGTTWGAGDGSTTFGLPYFPADYAAVQANANVGTGTVGQVISHTHTTDAINVVAGGGAYQVGSGTVEHFVGAGINSTGGPDNLAAGQRVLKCVKY